MGADPLTDLLARALAIPLRELYAVLVRVGVVQIVEEPAPTVTTTAAADLDAAASRSA